MDRPGAQGGMGSEGQNFTNLWGAVGLVNKSVAIFTMFDRLSSKSLTWNLEGRRTDIKISKNVLAIPKQGGKKLKLKIRIFIPSRIAKQIKLKNHKIAFLTKTGPGSAGCIPLDTHDHMDSPKRTKTDKTDIQYQPERMWQTRPRPCNVLRTYSIRSTIHSR